MLVIKVISLTYLPVFEIKPTNPSSLITGRSFLIPDLYPLLIVNLALSNAT